MERIDAPAPGRELRGPAVVLAAVVVIGAGIALAGSFVALVAFSALAAIVCRRGQLWLLGRGLPGWAAVTIVIGAFVLILGVMALAIVASAVAVGVQLVEEVEQSPAWLDQLRDAWASVTGLPDDSLPEVDPSAVIGALRSVAASVVPLVTTLAMAVLIVTYLLIDAGRLSGRMLRATSTDVMARYDALAQDLVTYVWVRAVLGGAAAIADTVLLLVLGVPYAVLWGLVSFLLSFIPNIGFVLALIPPTAFALVEQGPATALAVVIGYVVINLAFDYVLQPRIMASSLDLSAVVVIVAIVAWTGLIGPAGALLAVPLTIAMRTLLQPYPGAAWFLALLGPPPRAAGGRGARERADDQAPKPAGTTIDA
jgi:predicted PurR-regulated permease PerM